MKKLKKILNEKGFPTKNEEGVEIYLEISFFQKGLNKIRVVPKNGKGATKNIGTHQRADFLARAMGEIVKNFQQTIFLKDRCSVAELKIPGIEFTPEEIKKRKRRKKEKFFTFFFTEKEINFMLDNSNPKIKNILERRLLKT